MTYFTGIDIGSTASKVVVLDAEKIVDYFVIPTGWNSKDTSREIARRLEEMGMPVNEDMRSSPPAMAASPWITPPRW